MARIDFSKPVISINYDSLFFKYDSTTFSHFKPKTELIWNDNHTELTLSHLLDPSLLNKPVIDTIDISSDTKPIGKLGDKKAPIADDKSVTKNKLILYLGFGAFVSAEKDSSKHTLISYSFYGESDLAIIKGNIQTEFESFFIQLLTTKHELVDEIYSLPEFEFENIEPGNYLIRVLVDNNNNGKWDPGNYFLGEQNEDVYFYTEPISLRANWEVTDINISF